MRRIKVPVVCMKGEGSGRPKQCSGSGRNQGLCGTWDQTPENPQGGTPWEAFEYWGLKDLSGMGVCVCAPTTSCLFHFLPYMTIGFFLFILSCPWPPSSSSTFSL